MRIISTVSEMQAAANSLRSQGKTIGFVPTMGFLHEGHLSLMRTARSADIVVASIFVNPTQFGPSEDFDRYPRDVEGDRAKCESAGVDILFLPEVKEMYPDTPSVFVTVDGISELLEGAIRPGHYRGVATVVTKLFHAVKPHTAFFGQKDFQQCAVIKRMVQELNMDVQIAVQPTIRERDGLAMSSRNTYLSAEERRSAPVIFRALSAAEQLVQAGIVEIEKIKKKVQDTLLEEKEMRIDYVEVVDPETLAPLSEAQANMAVLVAVRLGRTRLIDNIVLKAGN